MFYIHINVYFFFQYYRMGDTRIQAMDFSTADNVYGQIDTSNTLPTTNSSLVNVQQNSTNEEELPQNCSVITFEENIAYQFPVDHKSEPMVTVERQTSGEKVTVKTMHEQS